MQRTILLFPLLIASAQFSFGQKPPSKPPVVKVVAAENRPLADRIEALGTLAANESVDLTAKVTENVTSLNFTDGQRVKKGDVLATMHAEEEEALLREAASTAEESRRQYDRTKQLSQQGAASAAQLDEARRVYETARARQLAIQSRINNLTINAPFDGVVGLRNISVGALVQPGDLITTIDDDSLMKLDFSVPSTFLPVLVPGAPVEARTRAFANKAFSGEIRSVSSRIDPVTRTIVVRAEIPNSERLLKPGLLMTVELRANERQAVTVPEEALLPAGRRNFVMIVEDTAEGPVARKVGVETGARQPGEVEILGGLQAGQRVITHGALKAADGEPVVVQAEGGGD
jgi:membrane fusion protein (multidrug efflux system)